MQNVSVKVINLSLISIFDRQTEVCAMAAAEAEEAECGRDRRSSAKSMACSHFAT
jgi:hypothetical protein